MIEAFVFLITVVLLAAIAVGVYFYVDYVKHKDENVSDIDVVKTDITKEKNDRLGNLAFVVEQVNNTNRDITDAYNEKYTKFETGFGSIIRANDAAGANIPLQNLGNTPAPNVDNIKMMKKVSVVGGMTINDIRNTASAGSPSTYVNTFKACSSTKCNEFPNSNGDVFLTGFGDTNTIVLDSPAMLMKGTTVNGKIELKKTGALATDPTATLEVDATTGDLVIKPPIDTSTTINGKVNIQNGMNVGTIEINRDGNLAITPPSGRGVAVNGVIMVPVRSTTNGTTKTVNIGDIEIATNWTGATKTITIDGVVVSPSPATVSPPTS